MSASISCLHNIDPKLTQVIYNAATRLSQTAVNIFAINKESEIVIAGECLSAGGIWNVVWKICNRLHFCVDNFLRISLLFLTVDMPDFGSYGLTDPLAGSLDESESTFENKSGLADDMKFLASMPELCDVTFLVGETREPVCAVKVSLQVLNKVALCP